LKSTLEEKFHENRSTRRRQSLRARINRVDGRWGAIATQGENRIVFSKSEWERFIRKLRKTEGKKGVFVMGVALPGAEE
jgi:hypothetical protein